MRRRPDLSFGGRVFTGTRKGSYAARGVAVAAGTGGAPRALRAIPPPSPILPREIGNLAYFAAAARRTGLKTRPGG